MPLYTPESKERAKQVEADVVAAIVHQWLVRVQAYSDQTIQSKREELQAKEGRDEETTTKLNEWLSYHRFNAYTLKEIEEGGLDEWFQYLFEPPQSSLEG